MVEVSDILQIFQIIVIPLIVIPFTFGLKIYGEKLKIDKEQHRSYLIKERRDQIKEQLNLFYWKIYFALLKNEELYEKMLSSLNRVPTTPKIQNNTQSNKSISSRESLSTIHLNNTYDKVIEITRNNAAVKIQRAFREKKKQKMELAVRIDMNRNEGLIDSSSEHSDGTVEEEKKALKLYISPEAIEDIEKMIMKNYETIIEVTENYISIARPKSALVNQLLKFIKYMTIQKALNISLQEREFEEHLNHSRVLMFMFKEDVTRLQREYNELSNHLVEGGGLLEKNKK
jgi:hypothetical protein